MAGLLAKERIIAAPGFNRWLVPPAALAIHLSIGKAYGFSVFWLPLSRAIGITQPAPDDWKVSTLGWMYTLFFVFLGSSAAVLGRWVEREGPRKAGVAAAFCWSGGFMISALGVHLHQIWMLWIGSGVIGGCGLGLGYISPVSTLIKWFPDRRGMATGMAIMGFGGGAMIGSPLADLLMNHFKTPTSVGVQETFVTMGLIYFVAMLAGAFGYRLPAPGWQPVGWTPPPPQAKAMVTHRNVHVDVAAPSRILLLLLVGLAVVLALSLLVWHSFLSVALYLLIAGAILRAMRPISFGTKQFWLQWTVLWMNVSAGIGVIGMASPMLQEVFGGRLIGVAATLKELAEGQKGQVATIGAGFAALLSLFNIAGRIFWASMSDYLGRKRTYFIFFSLGIVLYSLAPFAGKVGSVPLFVAIFCVILTMYGGGFATIPAYLADIFGTLHVGAIHGRLLTAWSMAGVLGPVLVNYIRDYQLARGIPAAQAYNTTMYILAGLLVIGLVANLAVKPVAERFYMTDADLDSERRLAHEAGGPSR